MKSFKAHRFNDNPQEKVFVDEFIKNHSKGDDPHLIVFGHRTGSMLPNDFLSYREKNIVLSTIQWLGSPVGRQFLKDCGYSPSEELEDIMD